MTAIQQAIDVKLFKIVKVVAIAVPEQSPHGATASPLADSPIVSWPAQALDMGVQTRETADCAAL